MSLQNEWFTRRTVSFARPQADDLPDSRSSRIIHLWWRGLALAAVMLAMLVPASLLIASTDSLADQTTQKKGPAVGAKAEDPPQPVPDDETPKPLAPLARPLQDLLADATPLNPVQTVFLDLPRKRLLLRTEVACRKCVLEMLCVPEGIKEHETVLRVRSKAYVIHTGLLALGLETGEPAQFSPRFVAASGPGLQIHVIWTDADGKLQRRDARHWVRHNIHRYYSASQAAPPPNLQLPYRELRYDKFNHELLWYGPMSDAERDDLLTKWDNATYQKNVRMFHEQSQSRPMTADFVFVGSRFFQDPDTGEQYYQAEGGYLICLANFGDAMIDIRELSSASDGSQTYEAWTEHIPPEGTPVLLEITPQAEAKPKDRTKAPAAQVPEPGSSEPKPKKPKAEEPNPGSTSTRTSSASPKPAAATNESDDDGGAVRPSELTAQAESCRVTEGTEDADKRADDRQLWRVSLVNREPPPGAQDSSASDVSQRGGSLVGRIVTQAQDGGILLEERSGKLRTLKPDEMTDRQKLDAEFSPLNPAEMGEYLQQLTGDSHRIVTTDHYVICSAASPEFTEYVGSLLELVYGEFAEFFQKSSVPFRDPSFHLPVIIHAFERDFQQFAARQHPETQFAETPGYYSVRDNLIVLRDASASAALRRSDPIRQHLAKVPREVSTIVHEAVHQLAFNTGIQVRFADNPVWLSEGLAVWFEPVTLRSRLLWNQPGRVNPLHHPAFLGCLRERQLAIPLHDLVSSDQPFLKPETAAQAYAESWALVTYLVRHQRDKLDQLLLRISGRRPLIPVSAENRLKEIETTFEKPLDEIERDMISYVSKLRVPRS